jgi:uncharacterized protein
MRFEVNLQGEFAFVEYRYYKGNIAFMHTVVPEAFAGKGIGKKLASAALQFAASEKRKIMLYCPFVSKYVKEHPEYHALVDKQYHPNFR